MKKSYGIAGAMLAAGMMMLPAFAFGETVEGTVLSVDSQGNSMSIQAQTRESALEQDRGSVPRPETQQMDISVSPSAKFTGAASLEEIRVGDRIKTEVSGGQIKTADSIQRL